VRNVAKDPNYAMVEAKLPTDLDQWRNNIINDQCLSADFRGKW
jgi:hypothetical protein